MTPMLMMYTVAVWLRSAVSRKTTVRLTTQSVRRSGLGVVKFAEAYAVPFRRLVGKVRCQCSSVRKIC